MQKTVGKKADQDVCNAHGGPEERKPKRQFVMFVEVAQIKDDLIM